MWDFLTQLTTFISLLAEQGWLVPLALIMLSATYIVYILIKYFQKRIELKIKEKEKEWKLNQYDIDLENHFMFSEYLLSINKVDTLELKWWKQKNKICRDFLKSYIYIIEEHYKKLIEELRAEFWDDIEKDLIDNDILYKKVLETEWRIEEDLNENSKILWIPTEYLIWFKKWNKYQLETKRKQQMLIIKDDHFTTEMKLSIILTIEQGNLNSLFNNIELTSAEINWDLEETEYDEKFEKNIIIIN